MGTTGAGTRLGPGAVTWRRGARCRLYHRLTLLERTSSGTVEVIVVDTGRRQSHHVDTGGSVGEDVPSDSCTTGMPMPCRICSGDSSTI